MLEQKGRHVEMVKTLKSTFHI
uniref:Uncharacterized protein n=1 Tax=Rhizophora mucronata TaxID=61149 RepID=A0A2P2PN13_RHIMU